MPKEQLGKLLRQLQRDIHDTESMDDNTRAQLTALHREIQDALDKEGSDFRAHQQTLSETLKRSVEDFEQAHPTLTMTLGRIMDVLNKMGI